VALVEEQRGVVRVDPVEGEGEHARPLGRGGRSQHANARLSRQRARDALVERAVVRLDRPETDALKVPDALGGAEDPRVVLEARLEPERGRAQGVRLEGRPFDRLAAGEEGSQLRERLRAPGEHAGPGRTEHLVRGDRVEVDAELVQPNAPVRRGLAAVDQDERAVVVRALHDLAHGKGAAVEVRGVE
jgi:hypothetical protein